MSVSDFMVHSLECLPILEFPANAY